MKKTILLCVACLLLVGFATAQQAATRPANGDSVPIEEYVPKVIIEGKWGTGPGEFGRQGDVGYDLKPESLAVDSKGNIYVLDFVNNRIQKYSGAGKHLIDILVDGLRGPVECWAVKRYDEGLNKEIWSVGATSVRPANVAEENLQAYIWPPEIQGINIVIDSKDTLYYYLKRTKDGKETGEVWEFRKDKLARKLTVPVTNSLSSGVGLELYRDDDSLIIPNVDREKRGRHYDVRAGKVVSTKEMRDRQAKYRATEAGKGAAAKPRPKYYLDVVVSDEGAKVVRKLN